MTQWFRSFIYLFFFFFISLSTYILNFTGNLKSVVGMFRHPSEISLRSVSTSKLVVIHLFLLLILSFTLFIYVYVSTSNLLVVFIKN